MHFKNVISGHDDYLEEDFVVTTEASNNLESYRADTGLEGHNSHSGESIKATAVKKRAIFAAPKWDPDNPGKKQNILAFLLRKH